MKTLNFIRATGFAAILFLITFVCGAFLVHWLGVPHPALLCNLAVLA